MTESSGIFNLGSLVAQRTAKLNGLAFQRSLNRLASGSRINSGQDSPAGVIASQSLYATLAALDAETNANERASDEASTADGALGQVSDLLTQAKTLVDANANTAGLTADEKAANQLQIDSILSNVDRIAGTTTFNSQKLLDGSTTISASGKSLAIASVATTNIGSTTVGSTTYTLANIKNGNNALVAGSVIDQAIQDVATERGDIGAFDHDTLQTRIATIGSSKQQILTAVSLLHDTDYAAEASRNSRFQLLQTASLLMLAKTSHANRLSTFSIFG